jgi:hypothetical protein
MSATLPVVPNGEIRAGKRGPSLSTGFLSDLYLSLLAKEQKATILGVQFGATLASWQPPERPEFITSILLSDSHQNHLLLWKSPPQLLPLFLNVCRSLVYFLIKEQQIFKDGESITLASVLDHHEFIANIPSGVCTIYHSSTPNCSQNKLMNSYQIHLNITTSLLQKWYLDGSVRSNNIGV